MRHGVSTAWRRWWTIVMIGEMMLGDSEMHRTGGAGPALVTEPVEVLYPRLHTAFQRVCHAWCNFHPFVAQAWPHAELALRMAIKVVDEEKDTFGFTRCFPAISCDFLPETVGELHNGALRSI